MVGSVRNTHLSVSRGLLDRILGLTKNICPLRAIRLLQQFPQLTIEVDEWLLKAL